MSVKVFLSTAVLAVGVCACSFAGVADMVSVAAVGEQLGQSLGELKNSVVRLDAGNQAMAAANARLKSRLDALRLRLRDLTAQEDQMKQGADKLKFVREPYSKRIAQQEKELFDINAKLETLAVDAKNIREAMDRFEKEDGEMTVKLSHMGIRVNDETTFTSPDPSKQKEKLKILKMVYDSKMAQEGLSSRIFEARKNLPQGRPVAPAPVAAPAVPAQDPQEGELRLLEVQVSQLQRNYEQWQALAQKMNERVRKTALSPQEKSENNKLRSTLEGCSREEKGLKSDIRALRRQMVDLDKRKSYLEANLEQRK